MRKIYVEMTDEEYKLYQDGISVESALQIVLDNLELKNSMKGYDPITIHNTQRFQYKGIIDNKDIEIITIEEK